MSPYRRLAAAVMPAALLLASCVAPDTRTATVATVAPPIPLRPIAAPRPATRPPAQLAATITALGRSFDGQVGIAVRDIHENWVAGWNMGSAMPQQSVSKLWAALALMDAVDRGAVRLDEPVTVRRSDLTLFHQPIAARIGKDGYVTTIGALLTAALTQSDNTANDLVLRRAGGPDAVRETLRRKGITGIAFGNGERLLQSEIAGLTWRDEYSIGNGFYRARSALPMEVRQAALQRYLERPMDGATPHAMTEALARLKRGELLGPRATAHMLGRMEESRTGPQRLRAGLAPGWTLAHKTGTGQVLGSLSTGYNDVGILTAPNGRSYAVAVMIGSTRRPIPERQALMASVVRAVTKLP